MRFAPDQVITRRYYRADSYTWVQPMRVVSDDALGLLLWHPVGSQYAGLVDRHGRNLHEVLLDEMDEPRLSPTTWSDNDILVLMPPHGAHSVWWFFNRDGFAGWYVNLEKPYQRRDWGVETSDAVLDIWVTPDRRWQWKDEEEFAVRTGHPSYFDAVTAAAIREECVRLIRLAEEGTFPFDGTYTDFRPDPSWPALTLPGGWERTRREW